MVNKKLISELLSESDCSHKKTKKSSFISEFRTNRTKYKRGREPAIQLRVTRNNLKKTQKKLAITF